MDLPKSEVAHVEHCDINTLPQGDDYAQEDIQKAAHRLDDPEWITAQKQYLRKLDFIILPTISLLYFFEYLDRGNVAVSMSGPGLEPSR